MTAVEIHRGDNTHHQDHDILPRSFRVTKTIVRKPTNPIPPLDDLAILSVLSGLAPSPFLVLPPLNEPAVANFVMPFRVYPVYLGLVHRPSLISEPKPGDLKRSQPNFNIFVMFFLRPIRSCIKISAMEQQQAQANAPYSMPVTPVFTVLAPGIVTQSFDTVLFSPPRTPERRLSFLTTPRLLHHALCVPSTSRASRSAVRCWSQCAAS